MVQKEKACREITLVYHDLYGNGSEGIKSMNLRHEVQLQGLKGVPEKVVSHERYIERQSAVLSFIKWVLGFVGIAQVVMLFKLFAIR